MEHPHFCVLQTNTMKADICFWLSASREWKINNSSPLVPCHQRACFTQTAWTRRRWCVPHWTLRLSAWTACCCRNISVLNSQQIRLRKAAACLPRAPRASVRSGSSTVTRQPVLTCDCRAITSLCTPDRRAVVRASKAGTVLPEHYSWSWDSKQPQHLTTEPQTERGTEEIQQSSDHFTDQWGRRWNISSFWR